MNPSDVKEIEELAKDMSAMLDTLGGPEDVQELEVALKWRFKA